MSNPRFEGQGRLFNPLRGDDTEGNTLLLVAIREWEIIEGKMLEENIREGRDLAKNRKGDSCIVHPRLEGHYDEIDRVLNEDRLELSEKEFKKILSVSDGNGDSAYTNVPP